MLILALSNQSAAPTAAHRHAPPDASVAAKRGAANERYRPWYGAAASRSGGLGCTSPASVQGRLLSPFWAWALCPRRPPTGGLRAPPGRRARPCPKAACSCMRRGSPSPHLDRAPRPHHGQTGAVLPGGDVKSWRPVLCARVFLIFLSVDSPSATSCHRARPSL